VGDIVYNEPLVGGLAYPSVQIPDGTDPAHPLKLSTDGRPAYQADFPNSPQVLIGSRLSDQDGGFTLSVCNVSGGQTHTLNGVTAKIAAFTAYGGQLNTWQWCDGAPDSHHHPPGGGCGGAIAGCLCFHAPFASNAGVGAQVDLTQTDDSLIDPGDGKGKLPLALAPGKSARLLVGMDVPAAVGHYAFAFGFRWDGATTGVLAPASPTILLAPTARKWTGQACQQPALLAQITVTTPESYYICAS